MLVDRLGRKPLLLIGSIGMAISLAIMTYAPPILLYLLIIGIIKLKNNIKIVS